MLFVVESMSSYPYAYRYYKYTTIALDIGICMMYEEIFFERALIERSSV